MNYYTEHKIQAWQDLSKLVMQVHLSGKNIGFYFDGINKARLFANDKESLIDFKRNVKQTPVTRKYIRCQRVRSAEKTAHQQAKRLKRFKQHLANKGIEYDAEHARKNSNTKHDYYINVESLSNGYSFRLYVKNKITTRPGNSEFSSYGLSLNHSTLPLF